MFLWIHLCGGCLGNMIDVIAKIVSGPKLNGIESVTHLILLRKISYVGLRSLFAFFFVTYTSFRILSSIFPWMSVLRATAIVTRNVGNPANGSGKTNKEIN